MGPIRPPERACLLIGALCKEKDILTEAPQAIKEFGSVAVASPLIDFHFTDYYSRSMGAPLFRRFYLYAAGFDAGLLADVKTRTNKIEEEAALSPDSDVERPLNLDPGYLTLSKLVLASTKDHAHRIFLRDGIYAEITLSFRDGSYRPLPWTFPDYASEEYILFFNEVRSPLLKP